MTEINEGVLDFSDALRPYENMWVALLIGTAKVLAADKDLSKLLGQFEGKDRNRVEFMKVPDFDVSYAPACK